MDDSVSPVDADRENGLPRVSDIEATAKVRDAFHHNVRVRWTVTVECKCGEEVEVSSLTSIVKCNECEAEWKASSALQR